MAFEISVDVTFSAAHQIRLYDGSMEPLHGHNWRARITCRREGLDSIGVVMDFHVLKRHVEKITGPWHNACLNQAPEFSALMPTAEHVAMVIAESLELPQRVQLSSVEVWETDDCRAAWIAR